MRLPLHGASLRRTSFGIILPLVIFESSLGCHDWAASDLSTSTARRRIWDGELPAVRLGSGQYQRRATPR